MTDTSSTPSGAAVCWNCQQPLQAGSPRCLWCGVSQQAAPAQLVVAPGPLVPAGVVPAAVASRAGTPSARPTRENAAAIPAAPRAPRGAATLGPAFAGSAAAVPARVIAFTLDAIVVAVVTGATFWFTHHVIFAALAFVELVVILMVMEARTGLTVGNAVLRLRLSRDDAPYSAGVGRSFVRVLILGVGFLVAGVGAWIVVSTSGADPTGRGRSWADRGARTVVVAVPPRAARVRRTSPGQTAVAPAGVVSVASGVPEIPAAHAIPVAETAPVVLAAPQVISTASRASMIDENSSSSAVTGAGAVPFAGLPLPAVEHIAETVAQPAKSQVAPTSDGTLLLVFDTGQREQLATPVAVNLGRNPVATEAADQLITVRDPEGTVSKTHLRLEHSRGRTWVTDGGSTNGTDLISEDGDITTLTGGQRVVLDDGVRVRLGNRTFTVSLLIGGEKES